MGFWSNLKEKLKSNKNEQLVDVVVDDIIVNEGLKKEVEVVKEAYEIDDKLIQKEEAENEQIIISNQKNVVTQPVVNVKKVKKDAKIDAKEAKLKIKEKAKKEKAEKIMLKSALDFSKEIKKLSKKYSEADDDFFEELEEVLIKTDMGMKLVIRISNSIQKRLNKKNDFDEVKELLVEEIYKEYTKNSKRGIENIHFANNRLNVFLIVGVNGTGKTTSLSKIANYYAKQGKKVLIAAADTFRAGAVEQLEEWIDTRLDNAVDLVKGQHTNQDPASVIFNAIKKAKDENYDLLLIDTAGRLQNKINLMAELEKMYQVIHKFDTTAPHETLLVIDATTGQNGIIQAESFNEVTKLSGIILTKMDGTSKGGIALAIKDQLNIPVKLMGVGEQVDDLVEFDVEQYVYSLVAGFMEATDDEF